MRMAPALVPRETMLWLQEQKPDGKAVFFNHFPMDSSVLNYFDVTRELKRLDVRLEIGGHLHTNTIRNYTGIPGIICRSALATNGATGYTIFRLWDDRVEATERRIWMNAGSSVDLKWYETDLKHVVDTVTYDSHGLPSDYPWMKYDVNDRYPEVQEVWKVQGDHNTASGFAVRKGTAVYTTAAYPTGEVIAIKLSDGSRVWRKIVQAKVFSTPAVSGNRFIAPGKSTWFSFKAGNGRMNVLANMMSLDGKEQHTVASPAVFDGIMYGGTSNGTFYAVSVKKRDVIWRFDGVEGHMSSTPYVDEEQVVFGTWGRKLYSLDPKTGELQWTWTGPSSSRMISPANVVPVKANGKIFIAVPNRKVYALDAVTGKELYVADGGRDAICLSEDGSTLYSKTMFNHVYALDTSTPTEKRLWEAVDSTGYDISPTALTEIAGTLLIPTDKGNIIALDSSNGKFLWAHKISTALVNPLTAWREKDRIMILCSTMDGTIELLSAPSNEKEEADNR
jgi:outer membrane protein assembly factor BamB